MGGTAAATHMQWPLALLIECVLVSARVAGASVAIHGNQIIVGSASYYYMSDSTGQYTAGYGDQKAYVFEKLDDGWSTDPYTTLEMPSIVCGCGIGTATAQDFGESPSSSFFCWVHVHC